MSLPSQLGSPFLSQNTVSSGTSNANVSVTMESIKNFIRDYLSDGHRTLIPPDDQAPLKRALSQAMELTSDRGTHFYREAFHVNVDFDLLDYIALDEVFCAASDILFRNHEHMKKTRWEGVHIDILRQLVAEITRRNRLQENYVMVYAALQWWHCQNLTAASMKLCSPICIMKMQIAQLQISDANVYPNYEQWIEAVCTAQAVDAPNPTIFTHFILQPCMALFSNANKYYRLAASMLLDADAILMSDKAHLRLACMTTPGSAKRKGEHPFHNYILQGFVARCYSKPGCPIRQDAQFANNNQGNNQIDNLFPRLSIELRQFCLARRTDEELRDVCTYLNYVYKSIMAAQNVQVNPFTVMALQGLDAAPCLFFWPEMVDHWVARSFSIDYIVAHRSSHIHALVEGGSVGPLAWAEHELKTVLSITGQEFLVRRRPDSTLLACLKFKPVTRNMTQKIVEWVHGIATRIQRYTQARGHNRALASQMAELAIIQQYPEDDEVRAINRVYMNDFIVHFCDALAYSARVRYYSFSAPQLAVIGQAFWAILRAQLGEPVRAVVEINGRNLAGIIFGGENHRLVFEPFVNHHYIDEIVDLPHISFDVEGVDLPHFMSQAAPPPDYDDAHTVYSQVSLGSSFTSTEASTQSTSQSSSSGSSSSSSMNSERERVLHWGAVVQTMTSGVSSTESSTGSSSGSSGTSSWSTVSSGSSTSVTTTASQGTFRTQATSTSSRSKRTRSEVDADELTQTSISTPSSIGRPSQSTQASDGLGKRRARSMPSYRSGSATPSTQSTITTDHDAGEVIITQEVNPTQSSSASSLSLVQVSSLGTQSSGTSLFAGSESTPVPDDDDPSLM